MLRSMVKRGWKPRNVGQDVDPEDTDFSFVYSNDQLQSILRTTPLRDVIHQQHLQYIGHVCRSENTCLTKKILFAKAQRRNHRNPWLKYSSLLHVSIDQAKKATQSRKDFAELVQRCINSPPWYRLDVPTEETTSNLLTLRFGSVVFAPVEDLRTVWIELQVSL